jgi:hypothetical protein
VEKIAFVEYKWEKLKDFLWRKKSNRAKKQTDMDFFLSRLCLAIV